MNNDTILCLTKVKLSQIESDSYLSPIMHVDYVKKVQVDKN